MQRRRLLLGPLGYLWTLLPMYLTERLADHFYLSHEPALFFAVSGWRLDVFIVCCLLGSIATGALLKDFKLAALSEVASIATLFLLLYAFCDPRVCFSAGPDGLEPLRFGLFLGSVGVSGASLGGGLRGGAQESAWETALARGANFFAIAWYPVIFSFAGAKLLPPSGPWGALSVIFLAAFGAAAAGAGRVRRKWALVVPLASLLLALALSAGIASAYLGALGYTAATMLAATVAGSVAGAAVSPQIRGGRVPGGASLAAVLLVLLMTVVIIPDAVTGVVPAAPGVGSLVIGAPVYAGAFMNVSASHASGARVTVSFEGTNASSIESGNFLSAGLGVHSPNCCVDGIDYAYRADVYLFHTGDERVVATGWEACDDNAACGGHSWKVLLFSHEQDLGEPGTGTNVTLGMAWSGGELAWSYSLGRGPQVNFTDYSPPAQEDHGFNTGLVRGVAWREQAAAYFYQFGVMSRYPIGHGGWGVTFYCPSVLVPGGWTCMTHAGTLQGASSYWKVIWRWGDDYPGVVVSSPEPGTAVFGFSPTETTPNLQGLW